MRRVEIAILTVGLMLVGSAGCFESDAKQQSARAEAAPAVETATPVAFDLFGSQDDDAAEAGATGERVEHAVFWRSDSGIPEAQPSGIPTSFADLAERVAPAVVSIQTTGTIDLIGAGKSS